MAENYEQKTFFNVPPRPHFNLFSSFQTKIIIFTAIIRKNAHPVYGAEIRTHDLQIMSLHNAHANKNLLWNFNCRFGVISLVNVL